MSPGLSRNCHRGATLHRKATAPRGGKAGGERIREPGDLRARDLSEVRADDMTANPKLSPNTMQVRSRREAGRDLPLLVWRWPAPMRAIASAPHGGGVGVRRWVVNAQVPMSYGRRDPDHHLAKLAVSLGLPGRGVGMLTAADVRAYAGATDSGVEALVTVGLGHPTLAAAPDQAGPVSLVGTINVVAIIPERLSDAALVNAVATVSEAKAQALRDLGLDATGTATDACCILCPGDGQAHAFGGPRSLWGARLARAVHRAVLDGGRARAAT